MTELLCILIGLAVGIGIHILIYFIRIRPQLWIRERHNEQLDIEEQELREKVQALDQEAWELSDEISQQRHVVQTLQIEIAVSQAKKEALYQNLVELELQAQTTANAIYEKNMALMSANLNESAEKKRIEFQQAEEDYQKEYLTALQDLSSSFDTEITEKKEKLAQARLVLKELAEKINAAVAANKRALEIQEESNFYKINISQSDLNEIKKLQEIIPYLKDQEALNKVIWKVYYEKPTSDMIGRIIGNERKTGIYKLTNTINQMCYVGQAVDIASRWKQHIKRGLGAEPPTRNKLYPAMAEYGIENFTFELIEECDTSLLDEREDFWQDHFHAKDFGYSIK